MTVRKEVRVNKKFVVVVVCILFFSLSLVGCTKKNDSIVIGISQWVSNDEFESNIEGFKKGLANHGYLSENIKFIQRNPEADEEKQREIIQEFVDADVDLIYSLTTPGTLVAKELTSKNKIPIVFSIVTYPVEAELIDSLSDSGNNLVGTRNYLSANKQYYSFERIYSDTKTLAFVHRKDEINSGIQYKEYMNYLGKRGISVLDVAAIDLDDISLQLESNKENIDSLFSACDTLIQSGGEELVIEFSKVNKKPSFTCNKGGVLKGALVGNVADFENLGMVSGEKAAQILDGSEPSWLLTESPREDHIVINTKTAKSLGLEVPSDLINSAKEIINK